MKTNLYRTLSAAFALVVALPANAEEPKKSKEPGGVPAPAPVDPNVNWRHLKVAVGAPRVEGATAARPEAAVQNLKPLLAACYARAVMRGSKQQGTAEFVLLVNGSGNVVSVQVTPRTGRSFAPGLVACWSSAAQRAHFERPSHDGASVGFEVEFSPEEGPSDAPERKRKYSGPVRVSVGGQLSTSGEPLTDAAPGVLRWGSALRPCGDLARAVPDASNGLLGSFDLRLTVAPDGKVSHVPPLAEIMARPFHPDAALQNAVACVLEHAQLLHFAPRAGESQLQVAVEFRKAPTPARRGH